MWREISFHFSNSNRDFCFCRVLHVKFLGPLGWSGAGNQVAQSIRATNKGGQTSMEALHANAAHQQGMLSAAASILELAAGGGSFNEDGALQVSEDHVQVERMGNSIVFSASLNKKFQFTLCASLVVKCPAQ